MKILVAGCSFAEHLTPMIKKQIPGAVVTNTATWGVGNKFISDAVVLATIREKFDLVYVSWTGLSRYDVCVNPENKPMFVDWGVKKDLFNRFYVCTGGVGSWDHHHHQFGDLLFKGYHKFVDQEQLHYNSLLEILKIQSYLKLSGIPFYFTGMINQFNADPDTMLHHTCEFGVTRYESNKELVDQIDFDRWIFGPDGGGIYETVKQAGLLWDQDNFHPSIPGYNYWIDFVVDRLKKDKIL